MEKDGVGFRTGASSLTVYYLGTKGGGGCMGGRGKTEKMEVRFEFREEEEEDTIGRWREAFERWREESGRPKKLLVLVNPVGGSGKALKIYRDVVEPLFNAAQITVYKQETQYFQQAIEIAKNLDLSDLDGVVCVSGDGIVVEVVNGFLQRPDWRTAMQLPLGCIPAGSGNGMAKSLLDMEGVDFSVLNSAFSIVKGGTKKVDVATISQEDKQFHSVLNFYWGLTADADIESEKYRWMGGARLTFQALVRIASMRKYSGTISYLLAETAESTVGSNLNRETDKNSETKKYLGPKPIPASERGGWKRLEGEFVLVWLQNTTWAASDMKITPFAKFSDGCMDMVVVRKVSKVQLLTLFLQIESGDHIKSSFVEYYKVRAARLEAGGRVGSGVEGGYVCVDGEVIARGNGSLGNSSHDPMTYQEPFEMTVQQGLATFFSYV